MSKKTPLPNGPNGRDSRGRFTPGNAGGPGSPYAKRVAELRSALLGAVTADDVVAVVKALLAKALSGDVGAIRELFDRLLGQPQPADLVERMDVLETLLTERSKT